MGYELYRLLANKTQKKKRKKDAGPEIVDIDEEDRDKHLLDGESCVYINNVFIRGKNYLLNKGKSVSVTMSPINNAPPRLLRQSSASI